MKQATGTNSPVLIVGAGPAGLTTAITLARQGIGSILVERRPGPSDLPRATGISTRTMELIRSWGLEQAVRAGEVEVEWKGWWTDTLASDEGIAVSLGYPTREQAAVISPTAPACVSQDHLEPVLLDHLRSFPEADVRFGVEVTAIAQGPDGATAVARDGDGKSSIIRADYVVAADGAHSTVRTSMGIPMDGPDDLVKVATVLFRGPLWDIAGDNRYGIYIIADPDAAGVLVPAGIGDRWLYGRELESGERLEDFTVDRLENMIRRAAGRPDLEFEIERTGNFSFAAQIARRYREGDVFLIGDAAHRVTPRGGTGMNTAIHDGHDLGWKLAWVLNGWAGDGLLDTYETDRRPIGAHNTARSADPDGSRREAFEGLAADLAGRLPHVWLPSDGERVSTLDLLGPGLTLITGPHATRWIAAATATGWAGPIAVHSVDVVTAAMLGVRADGARLIRPDGQTVAWWPAAVDDPVTTLQRSVFDLVGEVAQEDAA